MNADQQIQTLIEQAPHYGANPEEVRIIAPALKALAQRLKHPQYFVLQTLGENWLMTTLTHRTDANRTKNVVYAFPTLKDAVDSSQAPEDPQIVALPIPVIQILFQMLAMKPIDSIVFFETSGNLQAGTEISRQAVYDTIRSHIEIQRRRSRIPPNLA